VGPFPPTVVRDRRGDGMLALVLGVAAGALGLTIWLVARSEGIDASTTPLLFGVVGLFSIAVGVALMRRTVTLSAEGIALASVLGEREIALSQLAGLRLREEMAGRAAGGAALVVARDVTGRTIRISARDRSVAAALAPWLTHASQALAKRWTTQLDRGAVVEVCKHVTLNARELAVRRRVIALDGPCKFREDAASTTRAILTLENGPERLSIDAEYENYLPLRLVIQELLARYAGGGS